jgi:hypothetical protein
MIKSKIVAILFLFSMFCHSFFSQNNFNDAWQNVSKSFTDWDSTRGQWLSESLMAMYEGKTIPKRNFDEDFTPFEMIKRIPVAETEKINLALDQKNQLTPAEERKWAEIKSLFRKLNCATVSGRSYGDPHITTFDKANISFQTAGEFTLFRRDDGLVEVQCRQKPQNESFSLNTAVAINLSGDVIGLYAADSPDNSTRLRVNGISYATGSSFILPHGGSIRNQGNSFVFVSPFGEVITAEIRNSGSFSFINVNVQVFSCDALKVGGILGNLNSDPDDDFVINSRKPTVNYSQLFGNSLFAKMGMQAEKQYLSYLANQFSDKWRVTKSNSLFEYNPGKSTLTYTDRTFPRVHLTVNDLTPKQQADARDKCEAMGVGNEDLRGCIFDNGFLGIDPNPRIPVPDFARGEVFPSKDISTIKNIIQVPMLDKNLFKGALKGKNFFPKKINGSNMVKSLIPTNKVIPQTKINSQSVNPVKNINKVVPVKGK